MISYKATNYRPTDSMSALICDNYSMLLVMSRFGIDLGFGESTIEQTCLKSGVDCHTFLAVVNILTADNKQNIKIEHSAISLESLIKYLHNSHAYFLEYRLPTIRCELVAALDKDIVSSAILNYYDEYVAEVHKHMMYEENTLFPYINSIISGERNTQYSIEAYSKHHDNIEAKLSELKNIIIKYYPARSTIEMNNVLYDIFSCEADLAAHNNIEDYLLVPTIKYIEKL